MSNLNQLPTFDHEKIAKIDAEIAILDTMGFNKFIVDDRFFPLSTKEYKYYQDKGFEVTYPNLINNGYITW